MDTYLKILKLEKKILEHSDNLHWARWIEKDIYEWENNQSTKHHKGAFGGMGSINDITVGDNNQNGAWQENLFQLLKSMSWTFAVKRKIEYPKINLQQFEGMICRTCEYAEISEYSFYNILAIRNLPHLIKEWLPTENFETLLNIQEFTKNAIIENESEKLKRALTDSSIIQKPFYTVYPKCPKCNSENSCTYSWKLLSNENEFKIQIT